MVCIIYHTATINSMTSTGGYPTAGERSGMAKTGMTLVLQTMIWKETNKMGVFGCHEVGIGEPGFGTRYGIVDFMTYNTKGEWRCYEIKVTKADFYSKAKKSFIGNFNYYVLTDEVYKSVSNDIQPSIGVYVVKKESNINHPYSISCVKKASRQDLKVPQDVLMYSILKSLSREYDKYIRGSRPLETWNTLQLEIEIEDRKQKEKADRANDNYGIDIFFE